MSQRISNPLTAENAKNRTKRQSVEIAKIVGTISMAFVVAAWLLVWLTDASASPGKDAAIADERNLADVDEDFEATEVLLGKFLSIRGTAQNGRADPEKEGLRVIEFEVAGIIRGKLDDIIHFERGLDQYQQRLKQAMTEIARGATEQELSDPQTVSLRGRICGKLNDLFGEGRFDGVVFNNFRVYDL